MSRETSKKINYLIVPCPGSPTFDGDEVKLQDLENDKVEKGFKLYLGAEDRMKAAVIKAQDAEKIILVGGSQSKVTAMFIYFNQKMYECSYKYKAENLICLVSRPDSTGNFAAIKKYFKQEGINNPSIAIISNNYHLKRLELIWKSLFPDLKLKKYCAEMVLDNITTQDMYKKELERREIREKIGCEGWKNRCYKNQDKIIKWKSEFWTCEKIILDFQTENIEDKKER